MLRKLILTFVVLFLFNSGLTAQEAHSLTLSYNPSDFGKDGYVISNMKFAYEFKSCGGVPVFLLGFKESNASSSQYHYKGTYYQQNEIESGIWKPYCDVVNLTADLYNGSFLLGSVKIDYATGFLVGCFGDTYDFFKQLGLDGTAYKKDIASLRIRNLKLVTADTQSSKINDFLSEKAKKSEYDQFIQSGDQYMASGNYEAAKEQYGKAQYMGVDNESAQAKYAEAKDKIKQEKNDKAVEAHIKQGDEHYFNGDFPAAKSEYKKALSYDPDNADIKSKIENIDKEIEDKREEEAKKEEEEKEEAEEKKMEETETSSTRTSTSTAKSEQQLEYERQQRMLEHQKKQQEITNERLGSASEMGAAALMLHYAIGKLVYGTVGNDNNESFYNGNSYKLGLKYGYGVTSAPTFYNSSYSVYDGNTFSTNDQTENYQTFTLDFNGEVNFWGTMGENFGWGGYVRGSAGHGILFENFQISGEVGARGYVGGKVLRIRGEYASGFRDFTVSPWIIADELGSGVDAYYGYQKISLGPSFAFKSDWDGTKKYSQLSLMATFLNPDFNVNGFSNTPFILRWSNGLKLNYNISHRLDFSVDYMWHYYRAGEVEYGFDEDATARGHFVNATVLRNFDVYGKTAHANSYSSSKAEMTKNNQWWINIANPVIGWAKPIDTTIFTSAPTLGVVPVMISKDLGINDWLGFEIGAGAQVFTGAKFRIHNDFNTANLNGQTFSPTTEIKMVNYGAQVPIMFTASNYFNTINKYWIKGGIQLEGNYNQVFWKGNSDESTFELIEDTELPFFQNKYLIGVGMDYLVGKTSKIRTGVIYAANMKPFTETIAPITLNQVRVVLALNLN